jgi:hypothetical protein
MSDPLSAIAAQLACIEDTMATKGDLEVAIAKNVELGRQIEQQRDDIAALKNAMAAIVQQLENSHTRLSTEISRLVDRVQRSEARA